MRRAKMSRAPRNRDMGGVSTDKGGWLQRARIRGGANRHAGAERREERTERRPGFSVTADAGARPESGAARHYSRLLSSGRGSANPSNPIRIDCHITQHSMPKGMNPISPMTGISK